MDQEDCYACSENGCSCHSVLTNQRLSLRESPPPAFPPARRQIGRSAQDDPYLSQGGSQYRGNFPAELGRARFSTTTPQVNF